MFRKIGDGLRRFMAGRYGTDRLNQCLLGLAAYVEGTVKGDRHALRGFEQLLHQGDVDIAFGRQAAEDYSVGSHPAGVFNVLQHDALFKGSVEEITSAWADDDVQACMCQQLAGRGYVAV